MTHPDLTTPASAERADKALPADKAPTDAETLPSPRQEQAMPAWALACSPRPGGNSDFLARRFARGFSGGGMPMEVFPLRQHAVSPCIACYRCERDPEGACPLAADDDSSQLFDIMMRAPALCIVAPIFFYHLPAQMKAFIDRGQSYWLRRARGDAAMHALPRRQASVILVAGRKRGDKLFEGSLVTLRFFLGMFNFTMTEPLTLLGYDAIDAASSSLDLGERITMLGATAAQSLASGQNEA